MSSSNERWLAEQIPIWESEGVVSAEVAEKLRARYADAMRTDRLSAGQMALGGVGALLIGLGVLAVIGFNWENFGRPMRLFFAFGPLLGTQVLSAMLLRRGDAAPSWLREAAALLQALAATAGLAIVAQIYNLGGSWEDFMLACCLISLPLMWAMRSSLVAICYLIGIAVWAQSNSWNLVGLSWWQDARLYPLLVAGMLPFWPGLNAQRPALGNSVRWIWALTFPMGLSIATHAAIRDADVSEYWGGWGFAWTISLVGALMVLFPLSAAGVEESTKRKPQLVVGTLILLVFSIGSTFASSSSDLHSISKVLQIPWVAVMCVVALGLAGLAATKRRWAVIVIASLSATPLIGLLAANESAGLWISWIATLHVAAVGLALILLDFSGWKSAPRLGATLLSVLILARMGDSNFSLLTKGLAFILIGVGFIAFNFYLAARARRRIQS